jgi:creatinine amidohydrolase
LTTDANTDSKDRFDAGEAAPEFRAERLETLTWPEAAARFLRDPRLILPVGTCMQHGPHLPLGTDALIIGRLAEAIAARHHVLLAPAIPFGATSRRDAEYAGTASISAKTLHRLLNELVSSWEAQGMEELVLLTGHGYGRHVYALATVVSETARIRSVDLHAIDLSGYLEAPHTREHAGELATSLMLYLAPDLVRTEAIQDIVLEDGDVRKLMAGEEPVPESGSIGVVGRPSAATAEKGRAIFNYLVEHIGYGLFGSEAADNGSDGKPRAADDGVLEGASREG